MQELMATMTYTTACTPTGPPGARQPISARANAAAAGLRAIPRTERRFVGTAALVFAAAVLLSARWCAPMAAMPGMSMPGGWTMSMTWMHMPGQSWLAASAGFLLMWSVMMVAMMLPSLLLPLWRYRHGVNVRSARCDQLTAAVAAGYFLVWTLLGAIVFALGVLLAAAQMRSPSLARAAPLAVGVVVIAAGALQLTAWKVRALECCKRGPAGAARLACALWQGLQLGLRCCACCAGPTAVLLALGVMDLHVMAGVTALISAERLAPGGARAARIGGMALIAVGLHLLVGAVRGG